MNWFERHLNWSLFFGSSLLPFIVNMIFVGIAFALFWGQLAPLAGSGMDGLSRDVLTSALFKALPFFIIIAVVNIALSVFAFIVVWWYLGQKDRSKWFLLLVIIPGVLGAIFRNPNIVISLLIAVVSLVCVIILYSLQNRRLSYGVDFAGESIASGWQDMGPLGAPDDRQLKELDYTPDKNVLDMVESRDAKDVTGIRDVGAAGAAGAASEEAPAPEKVTERAVSTERLKLPILLDDAGAVIRCFYHPGADAVNLCSRCQQYVCSECNYITGTHPICRNCWAKRAEIPIAPPAPKQVSPASGKPEKQKIAEMGKSGKLDAEKSEWQPEFMALYEQASPIINVVTRKSADGMPASPLDLMEGLKLRPMLERSKKLSKPKDKELREAKSEFEQVLSSCIKIADAAADFVSGGGQALLGGPDFARIVQGIETASELMQKLSSRLASFSNPQE
jgi:hypothetical protein